MPHPLSCLLTVALFAQGVAPCALAATEPIWWSAPATKIWEHQPVNVDNYAPLAVGQLKHVAAMAKKHLDSALSAQGGAGPEINNMINTFGGPTLGNLASANVGQLKAVAAPFYKRFAQSGVNFDAVDQLLQRQLLTSSSMTSIESGVRYPWTKTFRRSIARSPPSAN